MSLSASVKLIVAGTLSNTIDIGSAGYSFNKTFSQTFANGTGASQANQIWTDSREISGSGNDDLDMATSLTNAFGTTLTFTSIKGIIISAASANGGNIEVGAEGTNPFASFFGDATDQLVIAPGGFFGLVNPAADGYAVTAGTGDILRIANTDGSAVNYDIMIIGEV